MKEYIVRVFEDRTEWINKEGQLHREDGPAIEWGDGSKDWYLNGKRHRTDGPACEWANGAKFWYLNGEQLTEQKFNQRTKLNSLDGKTVIIEDIEYTLQMK